MKISDNKLKFGWRGPAVSSLLVVGAILAVSTLAALPRNSQPKVVVSEYRYNLGELFAGQFMDHVFTIRNDGTAPLTLSDEVRHAPNTSALRVPRPPVLPKLSNGFLPAPTRFPALNSANAGPHAVLPLNGVREGETAPLDGRTAAPT